VIGKSVVGLDLGTGRIKGVLVDMTGNIVSTCDATYPLLTPRHGWAEQEPEAWWQAARTVLQKLSLAAKQNELEISGLGLSGQMNGLILLDQDLAPVGNCMIWADSRCAAQCDEIDTKVGRDRLISIAGKPAATGYSAPRLLWLRDEEPESYTRTRHILLPKDFLGFCLTGELYTDPSDASNTLLFDISR
jgi:xylulokinase